MSGSYEQRPRITSARLREPAANLAPDCSYRVTRPQAQATNRP